MDARLITKRIVETFNSVVKNQIEQPIKVLKQVISETGGTSIAERSLLFSLLADLYYEECKYHEAYTAAYQAYNIDPRRKEVLHSLMNIHLPRKHGNNNDNSNNNQDGPNCNKLNSYANVETAKKYAFKLESLYPTDIQALNMAAVAYGELGCYDTALRCLLTAHEQLLETEQQLRRKSLDSNCSNYSADSTDSTDIDEDKHNHKTEYRRTIENTITNLYLSRYRECPDSENFKIMKYLMDLIEFEHSNLSIEQIKMAKDEICERAEYVLSVEVKKENLVLCQRVVQMVVKLDSLNPNLICKIGTFYQYSNQCDLGIKYFSQLIKDNSNNRDPKLRYALYHYRGMLYNALGMPKEAKQDADTAVQLSKLRRTPRGRRESDEISSSPDTEMVDSNSNGDHNNGNGKDLFGMRYGDNKDAESEDSVGDRHQRHSQPKRRRSRISDCLMSSNDKSAKNSNGSIFISPRAGCATPGIRNGPSLSKAIDNESESEDQDLVSRPQRAQFAKYAQRPSIPEARAMPANEQKESEQMRFNTYEEDLDYKEEFSTIKQDLSKAKNENLRLHKHISDIKNELYGERQKCSELESELTRLRTEMERMRIEAINKQNSKNENDNSNNGSNTKGGDDSGEGGSGKQVDEMEVESLQSQLVATQKQLEYFRREWAESKTRYANVLKKLDDRNGAISELRMEYDQAREAKVALEKQLKIMKDANSKTKLRRRSQQFGSGSLSASCSPLNDKLGGNGNGNSALFASLANDKKRKNEMVRKQLESSNSPWIDRARSIFQRKKVLSTSASKVSGSVSKVGGAQLPPIRGGSAGRHASQRVMSRSFSLGNGQSDDLNRSTLVDGVSASPSDGRGGYGRAHSHSLSSSMMMVGGQDDRGARVAAAVRNGIASEQELTDKMKKISDKCHELKERSNSNLLSKTRNDHAVNESFGSRCVGSIVTCVWVFVILMGLVYGFVIAVNAYVGLREQSKIEFSDNSGMNENVSGDAESGRVGMDDDVWSIGNVFDRLKSETAQSLSGDYWRPYLSSVSGWMLQVNQFDIQVTVAHDDTDSAANSLGNDGNVDHGSIDDPFADVTYSQY